MKRIHGLLLIALLTLSLPGSNLAQAPDPPMESTEEMESRNYTIAWGTLGEANGGQAASDSFRMETATIGQKFAQSDSASNEYDLCTGFACVPLANYRIFLPLILRM